MRLQLVPTDGEPGFTPPSGRRLRSAPEPESLPDFETSIQNHKRDLLRRALDENGGVMTRAAKALGLKYTTFVAMVHRLGIADNSEADGEG